MAAVTYFVEPQHEIEKSPQTGDISVSHVLERDIRDQQSLRKPCFGHLLLSVGSQFLLSVPCPALCRRVSSRNVQRSRRAHVWNAQVALVPSGAPSNRFRTRERSKNKKTTPSSASVWKYGGGKEANHIRRRGGTGHLGAFDIPGYEPRAQEVALPLALTF